jgi:hypothetical protein
MVKQAGFFRELHHGLPDGPSLAESRAKEPSVDEADIVRYLSAATLLAISGVVPDDYFDAASTAAEYLGIATDGTWIWPTDLAYYVSRYHVRVPEDFVRHMYEMAWEPPRLDSDELRLLEAEALGES